MTGHTPWRAIKREPPDTPGVVARRAARARAMADAERLAALREETGATRVEITDALALVSLGEAGDPRRADRSLAGLRDSVERLGGRLVVTAVFPGGDAPPDLALSAADEPRPAAIPVNG